LVNHQTLRLNLRSRVSGENGERRVQTVRKVIPATETALLICDMWDSHWCRSAARRCDALAMKMAPVVEAARARGVRIIHAPSDCMEHYGDAPARQRMADAPPLDVPDVPVGDFPPLPIDDSDGGCDDEPQCETHIAWTQQHSALRVADEDVISESGPEVYRFLRHHGITTLLLAGVHTNMCILHRTFGIRQMTRWGIQCALVRDLTDSLYNPRRHPFVSHDRGTRLVIEHIERHWCPTILSADLMPRRRNAAASPGLG